MADYDKVVPPGKEGKVSAKLDSRKLPVGSFFEKKVTVRTNDPANPQFILVLKGTVKKAFDFSRDLRFLGFADEKVSLECDITNVLATPIAITGARWAEDAKAKGLDQKIALKVEPVVKGKKYRLKMWSLKNLPAESFTANIILSTDHPKIKEKTVIASFNISNDVEVQPARIYLEEMSARSGAPGAPVTRIFAVNAMRGDSLKVTKAVSNRPDMTVKLEALRPGKAYRGTITIVPPAKSGPYLGSIKLFTNYSGHREINVDVVGSVRVAQ